MIIKVIYKFNALFLTFVLLANNINNVVIVTDFIINQDFIAKTLCIQKEDQKGCNGKCHLAKQLVQNNTDTNSEAPLPSSDRTRLDVFVINLIANNQLNTDFQIYHLENNINYILKQPNSGFHTVDTPPPNLS